MGFTPDDPRDPLLDSDEASDNGACRRALPCLSSQISRVRLAVGVNGANPFLRATGTILDTENVVGHYFLQPRGAMMFEEGPLRTSERAEEAA